MKYCVVRTRSIAAATSSLIASYCRLRSSIGTAGCVAVFACGTEDTTEVIAKYQFYSRAPKQGSSREYTAPHHIFALTNPNPHGSRYIVIRRPPGGIRGRDEG